MKRMTTMTTVISPALHAAMSVSIQIMLLQHADVILTMNKFNSNHNCAPLNHHPAVIPQNDDCRLCK